MLTARVNQKMTKNGIWFIAVKDEKRLKMIVIEDRCPDSFQDGCPSIYVQDPDIYCMSLQCVTHTGDS